MYILGWSASSSYYARARCYGVFAARIRSRDMSRIKFFLGDSKIFDDVCDDSSGDVSGVVGISDELFGLKGIRVMPVAALLPKEDATQLPQSFIELAGIKNREFTPHQAARRTNLSRKYSGMGFPSSSSASRCVLATSSKLRMASAEDRPSAWQPGSNLDLAIQTPSSSCLSWI